MKTGRKPLVLTTAETFFKEWNTESAYVLGVLFADGNVCNTPGKRSVSLELKDTEHVHLLAKTIDSAIPVVELERRGGRTSAKFYLSRVSIVEDCIAKGLVPTKTAILQWPPDLPTELESHFVRGYFDGDGTVSYSWVSLDRYPKKLRTLAFACGSEDFAQALHAVIQARTGVGGKSGTWSKAVPISLSREKTTFERLASGCTPTVTYTCRANIRSGRK